MGKNNVNPDHYKSSGRERQGRDILHEMDKQKVTQAQRQVTTKKKTRMKVGNPFADRDR